MAPALLDINDCNLVLWHGDQRVQSPGYALHRDSRYLFGNEARAAARLQPRNVNTRYWWHLSTEPLQPELGTARHSADLAHAHLQALHAEGGDAEEVIFSVPASMQREQLALLLGIARACPFSAVGLVNRSVLLGSLHAREAQLWHLELQLHQSLLTRVGADETTVSLQEHIALPGHGLLQLQEKIVEIVAREFVRQTRFDPRRSAASEQTLYDALPAALRSLQTSTETNVEIDGYRARIARSDLVKASEGLRRSIEETANGSPAPMIADPLAALLPGFVDALTGARIIDQDDLHNAMSSQLEHLVQRAANLHYITALPRLESNAAASASPIDPVAQSPGRAAATHLLNGHSAMTLANANSLLPDGCALRHEKDGWRLAVQGASASVNGERVDSETSLIAGDQLEIAGHGYTVISVQD
ncbi:hypothetical protein [Gymnodinialimonas sp.]